jgi:spheroidene monooxygenase
MNPPSEVTSILLLARWRRAAVAWGLSRLVLGALIPSRAPGLLWRRILGSGHEGGFGLRPGWDRLGQLAVFESREKALIWLQESQEVQRWQAHAIEFLWLELRAWQSRGQWAGQSLPISIDAPIAGPVAALTRASIRPGQARAFWSHSPAAEQALEQAQGCRLAVGLGEAPILRQATFSLWDSVAAMDAYARSGAHRLAAQNAWRDRYFSETLFARFAVVDQGGAWSGLRAA